MNVVPDTAELGIGVRALTDASLDRALAAVDRVVRAECAASACPREPELTTLSRSPALWGDPAVTESVRAAHTALHGPERVGHWPPSMAAEDFPLYGDAGLAVHGERGIPLCYWMFGTASPRQWAEAGAGLPPNHSPYFAPDVRTALPPAITALTAAALDRLGGGMCIRDSRPAARGGLSPVAPGRRPGRRQGCPRRRGAG